RGRVVAVDLGQGQREARPVVPEGTDTISEVAVVNRRLVVARLHKASHVLELLSLDGTREQSVELPELGSGRGLSGEPPAQELFCGFSSYTRPSTPYRYDFGQGRLTEFAPLEVKAGKAAYETTQVVYPSKDGTPVSMFLVHGKGLARDGR